MPIHCCAGAFCFGTPQWGGLIGLMGIMTWHPLLNIQLHWWFRGPFLGGWLNFVLVFFALDQLRVVLAAIFGANGAMSSPFWFVVEGALVGLVIAYLATRFCRRRPGSVRYGLNLYA